MSEFTLALDTNFLQALFDSDHMHHAQAIDILVMYADTQIFVCPMVFSEALCIPQMTLTELDVGLEDFGIEVDWLMPEQVWKEAGLARAIFFQHRAVSTSPKRMIADFVIGAHALVRDYTLCTFDPKGFRSAFPNLKLLP